MYLTEEDAKEAPCPMMMAREIGRSNCIASACKMAWRWHPHQAVKEGRPRVGYCGLAGDPAGS